MTVPGRRADIEALARIAARIAGCDPDQRVQLVYAEDIAFDDVMWRYPDFLSRAERAYAALAAESWND